MRIAFFGGSFDPPHRGHLVVARAAMERLALDQVWLAPAGVQPLKLLAAASSYDDRLMMVRLAVEGHAGFRASDADAPREDAKPNYTVDVLQKLKAQLAPEDTLFLLLGADSLLSFHQWHRAAAVLFFCDLIVAGRPGFSLEKVAGLMPEGVHSALVEERAELVVWELRNDAGETSKLWLMPDLHEEVSATEIRAALAGERSADGVLPLAVLRYIEARGLYR